MTDTKVVWLIVCTLLNSIAYSLIAPFVPIELAEGGSTLGLIGLAFCAYPLAMLCFTPLFSKAAVPVFGVTNIISVAVASIGAIFIAYGYLYDKYREEERAIQITLTWALRLFQGAASASIQAVCMDIAKKSSTDEFVASPDSTKEMQILTSITHTTIIGFVIGPLIGSVLCAYLGSMYTFFIFGSFLVFFAVIIKMNFEGDAVVGDKDDSYFEGDSCYQGDNQFKFSEDFSSFRNDVTPERNNERNSYLPTEDYDQSFDAFQLVQNEAK